MSGGGKWEVSLLCEWIMIFVVCDGLGIGRLHSAMVGSAALFGVPK